MKTSIIIIGVLCAILMFHVQESEAFWGGWFRDTTATITEAPVGLIGGLLGGLLNTVTNLFDTIFGTFTNVISIFANPGPQDLTCAITGLTAPLVTLMNNIIPYNVPDSVSKIIFALLCGDLSEVTNSLDCLRTTGSSLQGPTMFNGIDFNILSSIALTPAERIEQLIAQLSEGPNFNDFVTNVLQPCAISEANEREADEMRRKQCETLATAHTSYLYCSENNKCYVHSRFQRANGTKAKEICNEDKTTPSGNTFAALGPMWNVNDFNVGGSAENCADGSPFANRENGAWTIQNSNTQCKYTGVGADGRQSVPSTTLSPYPNPTVDCNLDVMKNGMKQVLDVICEATLP